jgi:hypothetical protein
VRRNLIVLLLALTVPLSVAAAASSAAGPPVVAAPAVTSTAWTTVTPIPVPPSVRVTPNVLCGQCIGGGGLTPACYQYHEYGSSYLNSGAEGINMHLWFSACHDGYGLITAIWGAGQSCDAWGFINERNAYVNQDSGGSGQDHVTFHSHCEFSPSIGPISTFWIGHDLYKTAYGTD